jgi:protocatechuate 3,4-dioxygenase beta subunit
METTKPPILVAVAILLGSLLLPPSLSCTTAADCRPTRPDMVGPFYKPDAPERASVGQGYLLDGAVKSSKECSPIPQAKIEFWLTGPDGGYHDDYRATVYADAAGRYQFESSPPRPYYGRPPHIHIRVSAKGFQPLITQHYPKPGTAKAVFDLVLIPSRH